MAYDESFFGMYESYLREPIVRQNHGIAFRAFNGPRRACALDLGCGSAEYRRFGPAFAMPTYIGVDRAKAPTFPAKDRGATFIQADYMAMDDYDALPAPPDHFVSLFSVEACYPAEQRYDLYRRLFRTLPTVKVALVAGFYYASKRDQKTVGETGGITSYQTIEDPYEFVCPEFDEQRLLLRTPSQMFGDDVVEVWKILTRRA